MADSLNAYIADLKDKMIVGIEDKLKHYESMDKSQFFRSILF